MFESSLHDTSVDLLPQHISAGSIQRIFTPSDRSCEQTSVGVNTVMNAFFDFDPCEPPASSWIELGSSAMFIVTLKEP